MLHEGTELMQRSAAEVHNHAKGRRFIMSNHVVKGSSRNRSRIHGTAYEAIAIKSSREQNLEEAGAAPGHIFPKLPAGKAVGATVRDCQGGDWGVLSPGYRGAEVVGEAGTVHVSRDVVE